MSAKMDAEDTSDYELTNNPFQQFANSVSNAVGICKHLFQQVTPFTETLKPIPVPRPNAMVLLNAHGNYPYELFDTQYGMTTRQAKEKNYEQYTIETSIKNIIGNDPILFNTVNTTLFKNVKYTSSVPAPYCGMMVEKGAVEEKDGSSREEEYMIVEKFVSELQDPSFSVVKTFNELRHTLRENANIMYKTNPVDFSEHD